MLRFSAHLFQKVSGVLFAMLNRLLPAWPTRARVARICVFLMTLLASAVVVPAVAEENLDADINQLKAEVADLSQTLFELEESVLYPADTQFAVYLSLAAVSYTHLTLPTNREV